MMKTNLEFGEMSLFDEIDFAHFEIDFVEK